MSSIQERRSLISSAVRRHCSKMEQDDIEELLESIPIRDCTREQLTNEIKNYDTKEAATLVIKELEESDLWGDRPVPVKQDLVNTYELEGLQEDYKHIPAPKSGDTEIFERALQRCLIIAFCLNEKVGNELITVSELQAQLDEARLQRQVASLEELLTRESRSSAAIKHLVSKLTSQYPSASNSYHYGYLQVLRKESRILNVHELRRLIDKADKSREKINACNSELIVFIGETGSGKTTSMKALLGYRMGWTLYKNIKSIDTVERVTDPVVQQMRCTPACKSVTRYIALAKPKESVTKENIWLADTPGFSDTGGIQIEFANTIGVKRALGCARSIRPVIVISSESWGPRGTGIRQLARTVASLFNKYRQYKQAISIMFNRFTAEQLSDKSKQFREIREESAANDKNNDNYVAFLNHLAEVTSVEEGKASKYIQYDPLSNQPVPTMEMLMSKVPLRNPRSVFADTLPPNMVVKDYCNEIGKRVDYHLKANNLTAVKYFLDELQNLADAISSEFCEKEHSHLQGRVKQQIRRRQKTAVDVINGKIRSMEVTKQQLLAYREHVETLQKDKSCEELVGKVDHRKVAEENLREQASQLRLDVLRKAPQANEQEFTADIRKKARVLSTLGKGFPEWLSEILRSAVKELQQRYDELKRSFGNAVNSEKELGTLGSILIQIKQNSAVLGELDPQAKEGQQAKSRMAFINGVVLEQLEGRKSGAQKCISVINDRTVRGLIQADQYLDTLGHCTGLLNEVSKEAAQRITQAPRELRESLSKLSDSIMEKLSALLKQNETFEDSHIRDFRSLHNELLLLGRVPCVADKIEFDKSSIERRLFNFIQDESGRLQKFNESFKRNNSNIVEDVKNLDRALRLLGRLVEICHQDTAEKANEFIRKAQDDLSEKLPVILRNIFKEKDIGEVSEALLDKMGHACELGAFFAQHSDRYKSHAEILDQANAENKKRLLKSLEQGTRLLEAVDENNKHYTSFPTVQFKRTINFRKIEDLLRLVETIENHGQLQFSEVRSRAAEVQKQASTKLAGFRESVEVSIKNFAGCYLSDGMGYSEDDYSAVYRNMTKKFGELNDIFSLPLVREAMLPDNLDIKRSLEEELDELTIRVQKRFGALLDVAAAKVVLKKGSAIKKAPEGALEKELADKLLKYRDVAQARIDTLLSRQEKLIASHLKQKNYRGVRAVIVDIKEKHDPNSASLADVAENINDAVFALEDRLKKQIRREDIDLAVVLEGASELFKLSELKEVIDIHLEEQMLKEIRGKAAKKIEKLKGVVDYERGANATTEYIFALEAHDQLESVKELFDAGEEFKQYIGTAVHFDDLKKKLDQDRNRLDLRLKQGVSESEMYMFSTFFKSFAEIEGGLRHQYAKSSMKRLRILWGQCCQTRFQGEMEKVSAELSYSRRLEMLKILKKQIAYFPEELQSAKKEEVAESENSTVKEFKAEKSRLLSALTSKDRLVIESFAEALNFVKNNNEDDLKGRVCEVIVKNFETLTKNKQLTQLVRVYHGQIRKFLSGSASQYPGLLGDLCSQIQRNFDSILAGKLGELLKKVSEACGGLSNWARLDSKAELQDATKRLKKQLEVLIGCSSSSREEGVDAIQRSLLDGVKAGMKECHHLLRTFSKALESMPVVSSSNLRSSERIMKEFQQTRDLKNILKDVFKSIRHSVKSEHEGAVQAFCEEYERLHQNYRAKKHIFTEGFKAALVFVNSFKFTVDCYFGHIVSEVQQFLTNYQTQLEFLRSYSPLYTSFRNHQAINYNDKLDTDAQSMLDQGKRKVFGLRSEGDYCRLEQINGYVTCLSAYDKVSKSGDKAEQLLQCIRQLISDLSDEIGRLAKNTKLYQQLASALVKVKLVSLGLAGLKATCNQIIESTLMSIAADKRLEALRECMQRRDREAGNRYGEQLLSDCGYSAPFGVQEMEKWESFQSRVAGEPRFKDELKKMFQKCRKAFDREVQDFLKRRLDDEELEQVKNQLPNRVRRIAKELSAKLREGRKCDDEAIEVLGLLISMQTVYTLKTSLLSWPRSIDLVALLLLLGIYQGNQTTIRNTLWQLEADQSKPYIVGVMSAYLALVGYQVHHLTSCSSLSEAYASNFTTLYDNLDVADKIKHRTARELIAENYQECYPNIGEQVSSALLHGRCQLSLPHAELSLVLLVDEAAILLGQVGETARLETSISHPKLTGLVESVWKDSGRLQPYMLKSMGAYEQCRMEIPNLEPILMRNAEWMLFAASNCLKEEDKYEIVGDYIKYTGAEAQANSGWQTVLSYYHEYDSKRIQHLPTEHCKLGIAYAAVSCAQLSQFYSCVIGFTEVYSVMSKFQIETLERTFNLPRRHEIRAAKHEPQVHPLSVAVVEEKDQEAEIEREIGRAIAQSQPVVVFFRSQKDLDSYWRKYGRYSSFVQRVDDRSAVPLKRELAPNDIILATGRSSHTIRYSFRSQETNLEGASSIITYLADTPLEMSLVQSRVRCNDAPSARRYLLTKQQVQQLHLDSTDIARQGPPSAMLQRQEKQSLDLKERLKKSEEARAQSDDLIKAMKQGRAGEAVEILMKLNGLAPPPRQTRVVIAIEASEEMKNIISSLPQFMQRFASHIRSWLSGLNDPDRVRVQLMSYSNYDCPIGDMLKCSEFSSWDPQLLVGFAKTIDPIGTGGTAAVELVLHQCLYESKEPVDRVLFVASKEGNSLEVKRRLRDVHEHVLEGTNWSTPVKDDIESDLLDRNINIDCYSISESAHGFFAQLTKKTNGLFTKQSTLQELEGLLGSILESFVRVRPPGINQGE